MRRILIYLFTLSMVTAFGSCQISGMAQGPTNDTVYVTKPIGGVYLCQVVDESLNCNKVQVRGL